MPRLPSAIRPAPHPREKSESSNGPRGDLKGTHSFEPLSFLLGRLGFLTPPLCLALFLRAGYRAG